MNSSLLRCYSQFSRVFASYRFARPIRFALQMALMLLSAAAAFYMHSESAVTLIAQKSVLPIVLTLLSTKSLVFWMSGLDRDSWRFVSVADVIRLGQANVLASLASGAVLWLLYPARVPWQLEALDLLICLQATAGIRLAVRGLHGYVVRRALNGAKRVVIYGAGHAGNMLLRELRTNSRLNCEVIGFIDDDRKKHTLRLQNIPVLGSGKDLVKFRTTQAIDEVLIAISSIDRNDMLTVLQNCRQAGLHCKTIPSIGDVIEGRGLAPQIREIEPEDLLGRSPVRLDDSAIGAKLRGKVIAVTGAAGSIGSEICRQLARFEPQAILGLDAAETPLFFLDREFRRDRPGTRFIPLLGNIRDTGHLVELFAKYRPSVVYHAAAYKHVPLMESSVISAVENNVLGTFSVATVAENAGVTDFVMISTDKAVRPTSVMGLTKRAAELLIASLQFGHTKFVSVRFGNVMGSNGSVIPIFKEQIAKRQAVTVTHPEMTRFFMTIPEASQLVLQASTMGKGGELFVLDMGEPISIAALAKTLIVMSGMRPGEDIPIEFTGLRPGEKLHEELHLAGEDVLPTYHEKIKIFAGQPVSATKIARFINSIRSLCAARDEQGLLREMKQLVPEYTPSEHVVQEVACDRQTEDLMALQQRMADSSKTMGNPVFAKINGRGDYRVRKLRSLGTQLLDDAEDSLKSAPVSEAASM
jgi:FlaA1/EpsC-like NDP-sugar epimerase